jgi:hypothetical protein
MEPVRLVPRPVASSVEELLADAVDRQPFLHSDSKSGSRFERVTIAGEPHVVKYLHVDDDWTMRFCGDVSCLPLQVWARGLMDLVPDLIDHGMVGAAGGLGRNGWGCALLMRDLGKELVPEGDAPLGLREHLLYLDSLAGLAARSWGSDLGAGMVSMANRWMWFGPASLAVERDRGWPDRVPRIADDGWGRFAARAPAGVRRLVGELRRNPQPLLDAVSYTPSCFLHGDWKLGNIGTGRNGRTVLIDWTYPGSGPVCYDLAWYLSVNAARLPHGKEECIVAFRTALERHALATSSWWDRQLSVCLLGSLVQMGWEKALGSADELGWWCDRALEGERYL